MTRRCSACAAWKRRSSTAGTCWRRGYFSVVHEHGTCVEWVPKLPGGVMRYPQRIDRQVMVVWGALFAGCLAFWALVVGAVVWAVR